MLNYDLCTRLKEARFPQQLNEGDLICKHSDDPSLAHRFGCREDKIYKPTLSELIEACGDDFDRLQQSRLFDQKISRIQQWSAWKIRTKKDHFENIVFVGSTPEEAVANLYLELNQKQ